MLRKTSRLKTLAVIVATPNFANNAMALDVTSPAVSAPGIATGVVQDEPATVLAQTNLKQNRTVTPDEARKVARTELSKMTPQQKARLGRSQVEIEKLAVEPASITKCATNITQGVGCMDPATGGYVCCIVTLAPPQG